VEEQTKLSKQLVALWTRKREGIYMDNLKLFKDLKNTSEWLIALWRSQIGETDDAVRKAGRGKAVPLQACSSPEGSRKLRFPDYMTTAQVGGKVVNLTHRPPLPPENAPGTHFC
jgi:hypothetical protein